MFRPDDLRRSLTEPRVRIPSSWRDNQALLLGLLVASIAALNLLWVRLDSDALSWDPARHLGDSLFYKDTFSLAHPIRYLEGYTQYPPLLYWVTDVFYVVFGTNAWVAILSNTVFWAVLVGATYGIGKVLWSPRVGLLAALFAVTSPIFVKWGHQYMLDMPLSAMVALSLYFLIRSDNFTDRRSSLLLGAACGGGMLVKWTLPFFLGLPILIAVSAALVYSYRERSTDRLLNIAGAALITLALSALWYLPNYHEFRAQIDAGTALDGAILGDPPVGSVASNLWYFWNLVNNQLYLVPFLFFATGVIYMFRRDEARAKNLPLILSVIGSYIALSTIELKDFRYTMPMIAPIAVIAVSWLQFVRPALRRPLTTGLVAYAVLGFLVFNFDTDLLPREVKIPVGVSSLTSDLSGYAPPESVRVTGIIVYAQPGGPSDDDWHQEDPFKEMAARSPNPAFWFTEPRETNWFTSWGIRYYAYRYHALWVGLPEQAQFLIIRGPVPAGVTDGFVEIKQYRLPYEGPLRLYQRA
jgi:4-amino-4-deoxy-L-arabinose transferase-like glycosyltransferase